jgi:hypothetical protein
MCEMLRDWRLVHEETIRAQHAGNFLQRRTRTVLAAAHVRAGTEIDRQIPSLPHLGTRQNTADRLTQR